MSHFLWKISLALIVVVQMTQAWRLVCYVGSLSNFKSVAYRNASELITSGYFNVTRKSIIHAHGYRGSLTTQGTDKMMEACLSKSDLNCCAVGYPDEANYGMVPFANFPLVVAKAYQVQGELAEALEILWRNGMKPEYMHMTGLSLGAHVCGNAGRTFSGKTNQTIARYAPQLAFTRAVIAGNCDGMEPAKPSYDGNFTIVPRIDQTCGDFVDIIHTDTGRYGMATPTGHVDFIANLIEYEENGVQPGCDPVNLFVNPPLTPKDACSHRRALDLYIDGWTGDDRLQAARASNKTEWASADFVPNVITSIGENTNQTLRGQFYLRTAGQPPYGLGEAGLTAQ